MTDKSGESVRPCLKSLQRIGDNTNCNVYSAVSTVVSLFLVETDKIRAQLRCCTIDEWSAQDFSMVVERSVVASMKSIKSFLLETRYVTISQEY
jgi:hypothetical protein